MFKFTGSLHDPCDDSLQNQRVIIALDIGTTSARSFVFNCNFEIIGQARFKIEYKYPKNGYIEIEADEFYDNLIKIIKDSMKDANVNPEDVLCIGICPQRSTFTVWDKTTGRLFENFICWNDKRTLELVNEWNESVAMKFLRGASAVLHFFTRRKQFKQGKYLKYSPAMIAPRLHWIREHNKSFRKAAKRGDAQFGSIESWLLKKFKRKMINYPGNSSENEHISDISNAGVTGFFDPFTMKYSWWSFLISPIKKNILPKIVDNDYDFGYTHESIFGIPIKIGAIISDQAASIIGNCAFNKGDIKICMGTASIITVSTGKKCGASDCGFYPIASWRVRNRETDKRETAFFLENNYLYSNLIIQWAQNIGLFNDPMESSDMAFSVPDTGEVFFLPENNQKNCKINGFVGISSKTKKEELVRAILEGLAFTLADLFLEYKRSADIIVDVIRVDGGISNNDFLCQTLSSLCNVSVQRASSVELTAHGVAYLAAFNCGLFESFDEISKLYKVGKAFTPQKDRVELLQRLQIWKRFYKNLK